MTIFLDRHHRPRQGEGPAEEIETFPPGDREGNSDRPGGGGIALRPGENRDKVGDTPFPRLQILGQTLQSRPLRKAQNPADFHIDRMNDPPSGYFLNPVSQPLECQPLPGLRAPSGHQGDDALHPDNVRQHQAKQMQGVAFDVPPQHEKFTHQLRRRRNGNPQRPFQCGGGGDPVHGRTDGADAADQGRNFLPGTADHQGLEEPG
jgi:hypothetical protein